jgi:hypothetical protein
MTGDRFGCPVQTADVHDGPAGLLHRTDLDLPMGQTIKFYALSILCALLPAVAEVKAEEDANWTVVW